jgi:hypothetical protein
LHTCIKHDTNTTSHQEQVQEHQEWEVKHAVEVSAMDAKLGEVVGAAGCNMVCQAFGCEEGQSEIRSF